MITNEYHPPHIYTYKAIKRITQTGKTPFTLQKLTKYHNITTDKTKPDQETLKNELRSLLKFGVCNKPNTPNSSFKFRIIGQLALASNHEKFFKKYCQSYKKQHKLDATIHSIMNRASDLHEYSQIIDPAGDGFESELVEELSKKTKISVDQRDHESVIYIDSD